MRIAFTVVTIEYTTWWLPLFRAPFVMQGELGRKVIELLASAETEKCRCRQQLWGKARTPDYPPLNMPSSLVSLVLAKIPSHSLE